MFTYGSDAMVLPATLWEHVDKASKKDLKILLALAADSLSRVDLNASVSRVSTALSLQAKEVEAALSFWRGTGIVALCEEGEPLQTPSKTPDAATSAPNAVSAKAPLVIADGGLPAYSAEELSGILERRGELSDLIHECQQVFGKIFNTREVSLIAGLTDFLGLDGEYILLLLAHCRRMEKKSLRYVEKMAISLHDEGVTNARDLEERLRHIEMMASAGGKLRVMFGISSRAPTTKEKAMFEKWICVMQYDDAVLKMAYEITVDAIGKASVPYANTILERWYAEGYKTVEDVEHAIAEYRRKKTDGNSSFDVDDFFETALKRTYGE